MSSLVPGSLFYATGLNRKHTPTPTTISNEELEKRYAREPFNGRPWPAASPVSGVYDIRNSTTRLILLNNRRKKDSQLRGRSNPRKEEHRYPEPERHSRSSTPVNREYHTSCLDSSSPYYEPDVDLDMDWLNRSQRPQNRFAAGSAVNPKRHTSCQVPSEPRAFDIRLHSPSGRPNSRTSLPANFGKSPMMGQRQLSPGEQRYFTSISRVYSNNQMIRLKRRQYIDLLNQQLSKGLYTQKEYERYRDFIALGRQRQYMQIQSRAVSAPVRRSTSTGNETSRSISSVSVDDKSSISENNTKTKSEKDESPYKTTQQTKRSQTPDKRPQSVKSNSSMKSTSSGRKSPDRSSRSTSAKSTSSSVRADNNKQSEEQAELIKAELKSESNDIDDKQNDNIAKQEETTGNDSDTNIPSGKQYSAREGHDRPKSRLGHIPEDDDKSLQEKDSKEDDKTETEKVSQSDNVESTEESTQHSEQKPQEENNQKTKKSSDSDSDSSSEEEKDPDKLQY
ncbi:serine/arginine repetitive matrix protein 5-like isoform X2 [Mytilus californianus]|uniref:serine/arginine repetitive matrix protein 5-like isoform X2 n=1 Tax=Mytilus californianus TaxID=6549 RepID=UPI002245D3CE|nr:serine/arginine repetitive matrix protein 5-like isoform X2 [Mytilus californianus]